VRAILPGLAFAAALAIAAKGLSFATNGQVSAILLAIVFGILWRNLAGLGGWAEPGLEFAGKTLLRIGIALIGLRLTFALLTGVSGGRTWAAGIRPSSTSASFIRLCMSTKGGA